MDSGLGVYLKGFDGVARNASGFYTLILLSYLHLVQFSVWISRRIFLCFLEQHDSNSLYSWTFFSTRSESQLEMRWDWARQERLLGLGACISSTKHGAGLVGSQGNWGIRRVYWFCQLEWRRQKGYLSFWLLWIRQVHAHRKKSRVSLLVDTPKRFTQNSWTM